MQTTGRPKKQSGYPAARTDEQASNLKRRVTTAAVACDHVLHGVGRSVFILAPFFMLALLIVGLGYVRLRHGPISLTFLVEPIERGINAELGGNSVRIDDAVVSLAETGGLEFRLRNIRMHEKDGDVVASAPFAAVELSTSALWSMRIVPARIELIEPRLFLYYSENGGLAMSFSKPAATVDEAPVDNAASGADGARSGARDPGRAADGRRRRTTAADRSCARCHRHVLARPPAARCELLPARVRPAQRDGARRLFRPHDGMARAQSQRRADARAHPQRHIRPGDRCGGRRQAVAADI